jgi:MoaA/NifB/PqqE/SkfB family radical SAM enzyme
MLKHLLTSECNRSCEYCISRNVTHQEWFRPKMLLKIYDDFYKQGHREIMLTGGEPTMARFFLAYVNMARTVFPKVFITTQNEWVIQDYHMEDKFNAVTFSIHDEVIPEVRNNSIVYASILAERYRPILANRLKLLGYSGLTINEEHRGTDVFSQEVPEIENFSIRINRRGKCLDEPMILPDLTVITNFLNYL